MSGNSNEHGFGYGTQLSGTASYGDSTPKPAAPQHSANPVKDITTAEFMSEVIEGSRSLPVLVDFWAPWCGPCKQLGPALESAVAKAGGKVKLVKMNIDAHPEIAGQMGVQSIPAVVAFVDGQPKDAFMGAKPEGDIVKFIEKLVGPTGPTNLELALEEAASLMAEKEYAAAGQLYSAILQQVPDNIDAMAGLGMAYFETGSFKEAKEVAAGLEEHEDHPAAVALLTALELHDQAENLGDLAGLEALVAEDAANHQARYDLALALNARNRREEAADQLLEIISRDRNWNDDSARTQLLKFFEAWGHADPTTASARRRLSSVLFS